MGKTSFNKSHSSLNRDGLGSQQKMHVIWHDDEGAQLVVPLAAVLLKGLKE